MITPVTSSRSYRLLCQHHSMHSPSFFSSLIHSDARNPCFLNYLIESFKLPEPRALTISNRFHWVKTLDKPRSAVQFLKHFGLSDSQIRSAINSTPQILIVDFEKTLKPKLHFFQELGFTGSHLGKFISTNSSLLTSSLENKLKPRIKILKKLLGSNAKNEDLIKVLCRSKMIADKYTDSRLLSNALYLQSCGVVGSQLSTLLKRQPQIFTLPESGLRQIVNKVLEMGFSTRSRMLVHGLHTLSCLRKETLARKFGVFGSFGFSEAECMDMFRRTPSLFRASEEKLRLGIVFFMDTLKYDKALLIRKGSCLMLSMEGRVIPRYRVLQLLKVKRLLKKDPSFDNVVRLSEDEFLEKFISRFADDAFDLLVAYKGHLTDSP